MERRNEVLGLKLHGLFILISQFHVIPSIGQSSFEIAFYLKPDYLSFIN